MPEINPAWLALIGALLGGSGLKAIEYWLNKANVKESLATTFRNEIRDDLKDCKIELHRVEDELDAWKERYYDLLQDCLEEHGGLPNRSGLRELDGNNET